MTTAVPGLVPSTEIHDYVNKLAGWLEDINQIGKRIDRTSALSSLIDAGVKPGAGIRSADSFAEHIDTECRRLHAHVEDAYYTAQRLESALASAEQEVRRVQR